MHRAPRSEQTTSEAIAFFGTLDKREDQGVRPGTLPRAWGYVRHRYTHMEQASKEVHLGKSGDEPRRKANDFSLAMGRTIGLTTSAYLHVCTYSQTQLESMPPRICVYATSCLFCIRKKSSPAV